MNGMAIKSTRCAKTTVGVLLSSLLLCLAVIDPVGAIDIPRGEMQVPPALRLALEKISPESYDVRPEPQRFEQGVVASAQLKGWSSFESRYSDQWRVEMDARTKVPLLLEGKGIPLVPGTANTLTAPGFGPSTGEVKKAFTVPEISAVTKAFLAQNQDLLGVVIDNLQLNEAVSSGYGENNRFWSLQYQYVLRDPAQGAIPIRGAYVFARINHGNLVQFGNQLAVQPQGINTSGIISRQQATDKAANLMGSPPDLSVKDVVVDVGQADKTLQIVPRNGPDGTLQHQLVRSVLVGAGDLSLELWFDAHSGELVNAINRKLNIDASVKGGIYPKTNSDPEALRGLPAVQVDNNGVLKATDLAGDYDYAPPNSPAKASLEGKYVKITDNCGASSVSNTPPAGDLNFGKSSGTDCTTPGVGGAGNTHAARTMYYHVSLAKERARLYLKQTVPWLDAQLTVNTNVNDVCNANWNPSAGTLNFFKSDATCSNTGELAAVALHEFGHGLDDKTNGPPPDLGSGEAYGDTMAFLQTHDSCMGHNFAPGKPCQFGCNASCTGVRDVAVTPAVTPATITQPPADCDRWSCPFKTGPGGLPIFAYQGPMGYEGHCESLIASGAVWDMAQGFKGRYGEAGWALADRLWYESLSQTQAAYQVVSGGKCNAAAKVDGCGADNWYTVFIALDDDNGDLTDGTPNADLIWNAFNKHGIACGSAPPPRKSTCPTLDVPGSLTPSASSDNVVLTWTGGANAAGYRVFRNPFSCDSGFMPIADVAGPATSFTDKVVSAGETYFYAVQAVGTKDICVSTFSNCITVTAGGGGGELEIVAVLEPDKTLKPGESATMRATVTMQGAPQKDKTVLFDSTNVAVASVSPGSAMTDMNGQAQTVVKGIQPGDTVVSAKVGDRVDQKTVRVADGLLSIAIRLDPDKPFNVGDTAVVEATVKTDNKLQPGKNVAFSVEDTSIASVAPNSGVTDSFGQTKATLTAKAPGQTSVIAETEGKKDKRAVTVQQVPDLSATGILMLLAALIGIGMLQSRKVSA